MTTTPARWLLALLVVLPFSTTLYAEDLAVLRDQAQLLIDQGRYRMALDPATRALAIAERDATPNSALSLAASLAALGDINAALGRYSVAEPILLRSLALREKTLGADDVAVAASLHALARLYIQRGRTEEAEPLIKRAVSIREKVLGAGHPDVARSMSILASVYLDQKGGESENLYRRADAILVKNPGPNHRLTAMNKVGLAALLLRHGRQEEGEALCQEAIAALERSLEPGHAAVADALEVCAYGSYEVSEQMLIRALDIREKWLGPEDPEVGMSLVRLGSEYYSRRNNVEAQKLLERGLAILERWLDADDALISRLAVTLGEIHYRNRTFEQAIVFLERGLSPTVRDSARGSSVDPDRRDHDAHLAASYGAQRQFLKAARLYSRLLEKADSSSVTTLASDLSAMYVAMGHLKQAASLNEQVLAAQRKVLKTDHPDISSTLFELAPIYRALGRDEAARNALDQAFAIRTKRLGQAEETVDGNNCQLTVPPFAAARGSYPPHAHNMRMYPVAPGPGYSGCIWIWISYDSRRSWDYRVVTRYQSGVPSYYRESMDSFGTLTICKYRDDSVTEKLNVPARKDNPWERHCRAASELRALLTIRPPEDDWWEFW